MLGQLNEYNSSKDLFIGGLFHDIYRPAFDGTGNEDQTKGAEITESLLKKEGVDNSLVEKIIHMINSHDDWRDQEEPPQYDLLLSIADKICISYMHSDTYVWSVNRYCISNGLEPKMTSYFDNLVLWLKYQKRAWEVFYKYKGKVKGIEKAIQSYIDSTKDAFKKYENDPENISYFDYFDKIAREATLNEKNTLQEFTKDSQQIERLLSNGFSE
ncbi:MAG: HD domain-containing protein [Candidatus Dojkabacteria bacterium]|nr:HD domain-containing protein [Candidatus Dojkabacteria bacterium]